MIEEAVVKAGERIAQRSREVDQQLALAGQRLDQAAAGGEKVVENASAASREASQERERVAEGKREDLRARRILNNETLHTAGRRSTGGLATAVERLKEAFSDFDGLIEAAVAKASERIAQRSREVDQQLALASQRLDLAAAGGEKVVENASAASREASQAMERSAAHALEPFRAAGERALDGIRAAGDRP